jgi:hypothetical protein
MYRNSIAKNFKNQATKRLFRRYNMGIPVFGMCIILTLYRASFFVGFDSE